MWQRGAACHWHATVHRGRMILQLRPHLQLRKDLRANLNLQLLQLGQFLLKSELKSIAITLRRLTPSSRLNICPISTPVGSLASVERFQVANNVCPWLSCIKDLGI